MSTDNGQKTNSASMTEDQRKAVSKCQHEAGIIEGTFGAGILNSISGASFGNHAGPGGFKVYCDKVLAACGCRRIQSRPCCLSN